MPKQKHFNNLLNLHDTLSNLEQRIRILEGFHGMGPSFIEKILENRGLAYSGLASCEAVIKPKPPIKVNMETFYHYLHRYSFRLFLRDVVLNREYIELNRLTHFCSTRVAKRYLHLLEDLGIIVSLREDVYKLDNVNIHTFGETLEWYVAQVFQREFLSPALWAVQVKNLSPGGDFDVLAEVDHRLVYVEVKSSPPKGVHINNVEGFLYRVRALSPDLALFIVDTQLRLEDKIQVLFRQARGLFPDEVEMNQKVRGGVFRIGRRIMILNSKPQLLHNIRICLMCYFKNQRIVHGKI
jgi:hypothetical protein